MAAKSVSVIERLPADVRLVVRIKDAERQLRSAPGQAIAAALTGARLFSETRAAWVKLAGLLRWEPDEAFRRLGGRRLVLAVAGPDAEGNRAWAILSDIDSGAERALFAALRPAPRQNVAGQTILSLEDGRFELAVFCPADRLADKAVPCTIVLAPTGRGDLLDRIILGLAGRPPGPTLADSVALREARPLLDGDIFVMAMLPGSGADERLIVSASLVDDGWKARLAASPGALTNADPQDRPLAPWSARAVNELAPEAIAVVMSDGLLGLDRWAPLFMVPTLPEAAERLHGLIGRRTFLGIFRTGSDDGASGVALVLGLETPDVDPLVAPADAVLGRLIGAIEAGADAGEADRPDFDGFIPEAPRTVALSGPAASIWRPILGPRPTLAWVYRSAPEEAAPRPGWWLMSLASADETGDTSARMAAVCGRLARPEPGVDNRPRVTAGSIRIAEMARWLAEVHADPKDSLAPLRCIDTVRWDTWLDAAGRIEGTIDIRVLP